MTDFLAKVDAKLRELEDDSDLTSYAAKAALDELATNWRAAVNDGTDTVTLIADLDLVASKLLHVKGYLLAKYPATANATK